MEQRVLIKWTVALLTVVGMLFAVDGILDDNLLPMSDWFADGYLFKAAQDFVWGDFTWAPWASFGVLWVFGGIMVIQTRFRQERTITWLVGTVLLLVAPIGLRFVGAWPDGFDWVLWFLLTATWVVGACVIYRASRFRPANSIFWVTCAIVFSPLLAIIAFLLTWPYDEKCNSKPQ